MEELIKVHDMYLIVEDDKIEYYDDEGYSGARLKTIIVPIKEER